MRNDTALTRRYLEFQIQSLVVVLSVAYMLIDSIAVSFSADHMQVTCKESVEALYEGANRR